MAVVRSGSAAVRAISMADYYPLIAQAVESLEESTATTRRAIYDLARSAMLAKLRSLTPELSESDIFREEVALDDAIRRAEGTGDHSLAPRPFRRHCRIGRPGRPV